MTEVSSTPVESSHAIALCHCGSLHSGDLGKFLDGIVLEPLGLEPHRKHLLVVIICMNIQDC